MDGGAFVELFSDDYYFGPPDHFSFTDTFAAPGALSVTIRVQAQANWGNGVGPGESREDTALAPEDCEEEPTPTPTPSPTPTPTDTTTSTPTPVATPTPASTPREGTLGGNPPLPDTAVGEVDQTGGWLVAAGAALLLGITRLVRERGAQKRSR